MLLDHKETKLEIINRKTARKSQNTWRLKNTLLITQRPKKISQEKLKIILN